MIQIDGTYIRITKGDTLRILLELERNGHKFEPQDGDVIRFAMKRHKNDSECVIIKEIGKDLLLELSAEETEQLELAKYIYDIQITYADGSVDTFIAESTFQVTYEVE